MSLADCFSPCFELVHAALHGGATPPEQVRDEVGRALEQGVIKASAEFTPQTMLRARRLMSMWIDNRLGSDDWTGRAAWEKSPLLPGEAGDAETYLLDLAGHLDAENDADGQVAILLLECLGRGFNLDESCYNGLLGLLAERFKHES